MLHLVHGIVRHTTDPTGISQEMNRKDCGNPVSMKKFEKQVAVATCALFIFILGPAFLLITPVWFAIVVR